VATKRNTVVSGVERQERVERSGLAELYVQHAPDGIRLAYLLIGDRALAEDLVQEAFARFVGRLGHLRNPDAFGSYLRRTIVNLSRSHFRRRTVERTYLQRVMANPEPDPTPESELDERIHEALLRLPDRQRAALVLRFYEDLSEGQAAQILRRRPGTVRSLVSRGMKTLRSELGVEA
jgi:RNA polymerase sigma-70 factor (sigma-E family)